MNENDLSYIIRGAIFRVYNTLGPGLFETVYELALCHELTKEGLSIRCQVALPLMYDNVRLDAGFRIDILVEERVIIEIKSRSPG